MPNQLDPIAQAIAERQDYCLIHGHPSWTALEILGMPAPVAFICDHCGTRVRVVEDQ